MVGDVKGCRNPKVGVSMEEIESKIMTKSEFIVMIINGLTEVIVKNELDIDVLQSRIISAHKEEQKNIPKYTQAKNALREQLALAEVRRRIAYQKLAEYQKEEKENTN